MTSRDGGPYSATSKGRKMTRLHNVHKGTNRTRQLPFNPSKALRFAVAAAVIAWLIVSKAQAQSPLNRGYFPAPEAPARGNVLRVDALILKAKKLHPHATYAVFLAGDYLGEFTTNADGRGSTRITTTFSGSRGSLNRVVLRFKNPASDDICFKPEEGNAETAALSPRNIPAGRAASVATTFIFDSFSMAADASSFHFINWRSIPCVSTF